MTGLCANSLGEQQCVCIWQWSVRLVLYSVCIHVWSSPFVPLTFIIVHYWTRWWKATVAATRSTWVRNRSTSSIISARSTPPAGPGSRLRTPIYCSGLGCFLALPELRERASAVEKAKPVWIDDTGRLHPRAVAVGGHWVFRRET